MPPLPLPPTPPLTPPFPPQLQRFVELLRPKEDQAVEAQLQEALAFAQDTLAPLLQVATRCIPVSAVSRD